MTTSPPPTLPDRSSLADRYYQQVASDQLGDIDPDAVLSVHRELAQQRAVGEAVLQVRRPGPQWPGTTPALQVVTDDMPYLVESVSALLADSGLGPHQVIHPVLVVRRSAEGALQEVLAQASADEPPPGSVVESWMHFQLEPGGKDGVLDDLADRVRALLGEVRAVVEDTAAMQAAQIEVAEEISTGVASTVYSEGKVHEAAALLRWLADGHFTVLGYRHLQNEPTSEHKPSGRQPTRTGGLGIWRAGTTDDRSAEREDRSDGPSQGRLLVLTQSSTSTGVLRTAYPYFVGISSVDETGAVVGEHQFLGEFSVAALNENVLDVPVLARRTRAVIERAGYALDSYSGQAILELAQTFPRPELFSTNTDTLFEIATAVVALGRRRSVRVFLRTDPYGRFVSCLVYLPRDRYNTRTRIRIQDVLLAELDGANLDYTVRVSESPLALVHFTVQTPHLPAVDAPLRARIQDKVSSACRTWDDRVFDELEAVPRTELGADVLRRYAQALPESYKEHFSAAHAITDVLRLQSLAEGGIDVALYRPAARSDSDPAVRFTLYLAGRSISLSRVLPVLQSMDVEVLDEHPYLVIRPDGSQCWVYDFGLQVDESLLGRGDGELAAVRERFVDTFTAAWYGVAEVDGFNGLVLRAGLDWRQAMVLRAYAKYLRQVGLPYSQSYVECELAANPQVCAALLRLFSARLDPGEAGGEQSSRSAEHLHSIVSEITTMIDEVTSLDTDRILRGYLSLVQATSRTNYYIDDGEGHRPYLSLKLNPQAIAELPQPRPRFEIFVYSPRTEGVHLRFGSVARGGLRWSDRQEDFRTEILGLAKAQAVKNAVIVPVGAKGGFVVKHPPATTGDAKTDREARQAEGIACYRMFIAGLLDVTDNLDPVSGTVLPPQQVVRHDDDDTYLVVAADKGTASFSDIANAVSADYGYWLGDAFASGGSAGYDHKEMGITARGGWESVKRHFRELDVDTQSQDFTVVGIGDMSGDVFGNGMLMSEHIRLVAAFDHRHVFLDPDPEPERSFAERQRLYEAPRSSWGDYDTSLISAGGGVWLRTDKSVAVSEQIRAALGLESDVDKLSPAELVHAILLAPVDLLWNGGIGTYIKAGGETQAEVGDKANDGLRVNGSKLRVKVVGEGGNLGVTQQGRIEFARAGGRINTDALDNSAGVDCSDHEVNIKILLDALVTDDHLPVEERNPLLESMTDEVARLVLADNEGQNELMGVSRANATALVGVHARLVTHLERTAGLERTLHALPTKAGFRKLEQTGDGLSSPELATLMGQVKLALKSELLDSDLPDASAFGPRLFQYFPDPLPERFSEAIAGHALRREIITTMLVNDVIGTGGIAFAFRLGEETGASSTDAVRAHVAATGIFDLNALQQEIRALGSQLPTSVTDQLLLHTRRLLDRAARWLLSNRPQPLAVGADIARFSAPVAELVPDVATWLRGAQADAAAEQSDAYVEQGVPRPLADRVEGLLHTYGLLDVVDVADIAEREPAEVAELYYAISAHLDIDHMLTAVSQLERGDRWHSLARLALRDDLYGSLRSLTLDVLGGSEPGESADEKIDQWEQTNSPRLSRARASLAEIATVGTLDLATLSVAVRQIRGMVRTATGGPVTAR